jgi:HEAT repeat protein
MFKPEGSALLTFSEDDRPARGSEVSAEEIYATRNEYLEASGRLRRLESAGQVNDLLRELQNPMRFKDLTMGGEAVRRLGRLRAKKAAEPITRMIDDSDEHVQRLAVNALGLIGDAGLPVERLLTLLAETRDEKLRALAIGIWARLATPRSYPSSLHFCNRQTG